MQDLPVEAEEEEHLQSVGKIRWSNAARCYLQLASNVEKNKRLARSCNASYNRIIAVYASREEELNSRKRWETKPAELFKNGVQKLMYFSSSCWKWAELFLTVLEFNIVELFSFSVKQTLYDFSCLDFHKIKLLSLDLSLFVSANKNVIMAKMSQAHNRPLMYRSLCDFYRKENQRKWWLFCQKSNFQYYFTIWTVIKAC